MIRKRLAKNFIGLLGSIITVISVCTPLAGQTSFESYAANKKISLQTCRTLAVENSDKYDNALDSVESKQAKYESAVKSLKLKKKNLTTFRWSPLLNFSFPQSLTLDQESEFEFKPMSLSYDIDIAKHKVSDVKLDVYQEINTIYTDIYTLQKSIAFNEERVETLEEGIKRNEARLKLGEAKQADIDTLQSRLDAITKTLASDNRTLEADLKKLSNKIGTDVTTGYDFASPYINAELSRDQLDRLIEYTLDHDETYYEACIEEMRAKVQLQTNYRLMKQHYGGDINLISSYVNSALNGNTIKKKAFKTDYKTFLEKIDSYWQGKKKICWFIKIPRLWLKGSVDGTRYIEDDPNILYQDVLDYQSAYSEKLATEQEVTEAVTDAFNNYVSVKASYEQYQQDIKKAEEDLKKDEVKNRMGQLTFEEYDTELTSYEDLQKSLIDTMKLYSDSLYSLDRTTCGGVDELLSDGEAGIGQSFTIANSASGAYYYITPIIQKQEFEVSIYIPDDFVVEVTDFELWVDNVQIGDRTSKDGKLRHLGLTFDDEPEVKIRLYNEDEFIDDCIIDAQEVSGPLNVITGYDIDKELGDDLGTYDVAMDSTTGLIEITVKPDDPAVKYFVVRDSEGQALGSDEPISISKSLKHLQLVQTDMSLMTVDLYDEDKNVIYNGRFDTANKKVVRVVTD